MYSVLNQSSATCFCGWNDKLCSRTMLLGSVSEPMQGIPCQNQAWSSWISNTDFKPWSLRTEMSPDFLNLSMIFCTVDDGILKVLTILRWGIHCFWGILRLSGVLYILNHFTDQLPINLISCNIFLQLFLFNVTYFSSFYFAILAFLKRVAVIKIKRSSFCSWSSVSL